MGNHFYSIRISICFKLKMATNHKFIKSARGYQMLIVDDFCFKKDSVRKSKVYYKCRKCLDVCKPRAILNNKCNNHWKTTQS